MNDKSPSLFSYCSTCTYPYACGKAQECQKARFVPVPARTLQPGDVTDNGLVVLRVTPEVGGRLHIRFEDDDTLWRVHRDSILQLRVPVDA